MEDAWEHHSLHSSCAFGKLMDYLCTYLANTVSKFTLFYFFSISILIDTCFVTIIRALLNGLSNDTTRNEEVVIGEADLALD